MTRNATAELQHGRRGGGWAPKPVLVEKPHVLQVECQGGPLAGVSVAMHTFGPGPVAPKVMPMPSGGRYLLDGGPVYRWEPNHG